LAKCFLLETNIPHAQTCATRSNARQAKGTRDTFSESDYQSIFGKREMEYNKEKKKFIMRICEKCQTQNADDASYCARCGAPMQTAPTQDKLQVIFPTHRIPFEERQTRGFWKSLLETWVKATFYPNSFFPLVGENPDFTTALIFAIIWGEISIIVSKVFITLPLKFVLLMLHNAFGVHVSQAAFSFLFSVGETLIGILFGPLFVLIGLFIGTAMFHLFLLIVGGGKKGFATTLKILAYCEGAGAIPLVGGIWGLILVIIGVNKAHGDPIWKPIVAYIFETIVVITLIVVPILLLFLLAAH
jgi:ribosomal protein L40E